MECGKIAFSHIERLRHVQKTAALLVKTTKLDSQATGRVIKYYLPPRTTLLIRLGVINVRPITADFGIGHARYVRRRIVTVIKSGTTSMSSFLFLRRCCGRFLRNLRFEVIPAYKRCE